MPVANITYFGKVVVVGCDGNCPKAWGISLRPHVHLSDNEDDVEYLADHELGIAPQDPGTYEGGYAKPLSADYFPNKWCVRECERCGMADDNESLSMPAFDKRVRNIPVEEED